MRVLQNPITKDGSIRYFELFKIFLFVMFLFAAYTSLIHSISLQSNSLIYLANGLGAMTFIINFVRQTVIEIMLLITVLKQKVIRFILTQMTKVEDLKLVFTQDQLVTVSNTNTSNELCSLYCIFRC